MQAVTTSTALNDGLGLGKKSGYSIMCAGSWLDSEALGASSLEAPKNNATILDRTADAGESAFRRHIRVVVAQVRRRLWLSLWYTIRLENADASRAAVIAMVAIKTSLSCIFRASIIDKFDSENSLFVSPVKLASLSV